MGPKIAGYKLSDQKSGKWEVFGEWEGGKYIHRQEEGKGEQQDTGDLRGEMGKGTRQGGKV